MSIVIDARWINDELSGIGRYTLGLISGLSEINALEDVILLGGKREMLADVLGDALSEVRQHTCGLAPMSPRNQVTLPRTLRRLGASLYHAPYVHAPLVSRSPRVVITVHDLIPSRFGEGVAGSRKQRHRFLWERWCDAQYRHADAIVTVSDFSRGELIEHAGIQPEKVTRIYNGVQQHPATFDTHGQRARSRFDLRGHVITTIGRHDPYKNLTGLVRAFSILAGTRRDVTLVVGGRIDPRYPEAQRLVRDLGIVERVVFTDYLTEEDRIDLLRASDLFVFPSKYEGFGLPPLEAFVEGVPVIASHAASIPEVVGDAAMLIDPNEPRQIADAMQQLLNDAELRGQLIRRGREQAKRFTWCQSAKQHDALYRATLNA